MSITSLVFILFVFATLILYYLVPKKFQWVILLISSLVFYITSSTLGIIYVLVTATSIFFGAIVIENYTIQQKSYIKENKEALSKEEKSIYKAKVKRKKKAVLVLVILLNIGILCVLKYCHFAVDQVNAILQTLGAGTLNNEFEWLAPLGLSFYTFQSVGYIADVYWNKTKAQHNYAKMLLFVSFFPQVTQGPISDYKQLSGELFKEHTLTYTNYSRGFQRMVWGFFKKMVIANSLAPYVSDVFTNFREYTGITCFIGIIAHSIQLYADFSGYMDIMCGLCEMLDIKLTENFKRPFFSKSISEFWHRWHITLGVWLKTYIYYPISISKRSINLGKKLNSKFNKYIADCVTTTIALLAVWFIVGIWHGASWGYIVWGLLMGAIIIFSNWMEPVYRKFRVKLGIRNSRWGWKVFRILRTCLLFAFIEVIPEVGTLGEGFGFVKRALTNFSIPNDFRQLFPGVDRDMRIEFFVVLLCIVLLVLSSILSRRESLRDKFNRIPIPIRIIIIIIMLILTFAIGLPKVRTGVFMYAKF